MLLSFRDFVNQLSTYQKMPQLVWVMARGEGLSDLAKADERSLHPGAEIALFPPGFHERCLVGFQGIVSTMCRICNLQVSRLSGIADHGFERPPLTYQS